VAAQRGCDPVEVMIDLALESDFRQVFLQVIQQRHEDQVLELLKHPRNIMTFTDAGAHVSQIMDSSLSTHLLSYWVREKEAFTLEEAVRMLTLAPATAWGLHDRGLLREGMVADLNVFDPATVASALPTVEHDLPGGGTRLVQRSVGYLATITNGQVVFDRGGATGALPGQLIRR
jgi:N-acyl-D-aspartate/D-glutamate deacylase